MAAPVMMPAAQLDETVSGQGEGAPIRVLFIDRAWPMIAEAVRAFAESVRGSGIQVVLLSDKEPSAVTENFETINVHDVPQRCTLRELQAEYSFSLHKTLVPERAFYDYSSFRRTQCYSRLSEAQIERLVTPYANAIDYAVRERADLVIEWYPDCFIPSLAGCIAAHYGTPFRMFLQHYWWSDGAFFIDRLDLTSSEIDRRYHEAYGNSALCDRARLDEVFRSKKTLYAFSAGDMYTFAMRLRTVMNRLGSYEPISLFNWLCRRVSRRWSATMIRLFSRREAAAHDGERFVLYPLHISPEAALLGNVAELADQFGLIKNISMNLPYGVKLYVKEHPYADLGAGIAFDFYRRLAALPNVRLIRGRARLQQFLEHSGFLAVAVINGTLGLEAALQRKPVFVFGRPLYGVAECFLKPIDFDEFQTQLRGIIRGAYRVDERALYAVLYALDASIVRADVDFVACRTAQQLLHCFPPIWRRFVESRAWSVGQPVQRA